jgi:chitodextrinase
VRRLTPILAAAAATTAVLLLPASALAGTCATNGPPAGPYTATVCVTAPGDATLVTGPTTVSASVVFAGTPPSGIQRVIFSIDGQYLLTDYAAPYTFTLDTTQFVDGAHTISAEALLRDGFDAQGGSVSLQFANGVLSPPGITGGFAVTTGTAPAAGQPFVLAAAGDGSGGEQSETDVVSRIQSWNPNLFLYLGDVYEKGSRTEFDNWYAAPGGYGDLRGITDPTVGNHEYTSSPDAAGYFGYWHNPPHYYSFDAGGWHVVNIDANGLYGQTAVGTPQYQWLAGDLATRSQPCTLVYFHEPRWNIGEEGETASLQAVWTLMAQDGVDVVLNGHDHTYQRWQPLDASGNPAPGGVTEFVVGTGGHSLGAFVRQSSRIAASVAQFGALRMDLRPDGADWLFQTAGGTTLDSGAMQCSGTPPDTSPPSAPGSLASTAVAYNDVDLRWTPSTDDVGVAGYDLYRDGAKIASVGLVTSWSDRTVAAGTSYTYTVVARDAAGNQSAASAPAVATTMLAVTQFSDDFESGGLSNWSSSTGIAVETTTHFGGLYAAEAASTGSPAFVDAPLASPQTDLYYRARFYVVSQGANPVNLLKLKTASGGKLCTLLLGQTGKLSYRNDQTAVTELSTTVPTQGAWHKLEVHVVVAGGSSSVTVWLDDVQVPDLGGPDALGTDPAGIAEIGDSGSGRTYDVIFDNVNAVVSSPVDTVVPTVPAGTAATAVSGPAVDVTWQAASDDIGVTGYDVYRNGAKIGSVGAATAYVDSTVAPHATYTYQVRARDLAGNASALSVGATASVADLLDDGFESGALLGWTATSTTAEQTQVYAGAWAAEATSSGSPADAWLPLSAPQPELYARVRFELLRQGGNSVTLIRVRTATGTAIASAFVSSSGKLGTRSDISSTTTTSTTAVSAGTWHELQLHVLTGASPRIDVWLDGVPIPGLSTTPALGTTALGRVELGEASSGRTFDVAFDDVAADTQQIVEAFPPSAPANVSAVPLAGFVARVAWSAATDNVGVAGYTVYRDGTQIAKVDASTLAFLDTAVDPASSHSYSVAATDTAGNVSQRSAPAPITMPPVSLFADGFESGDLSAWTASSGVVTQQAQAYTGAWAAAATSSAGTPAWLDRSLAAPQVEVYTRVRFLIRSLATTTNLLKLRTASGGSVLSVYLSSADQLGVRNEVAATSTTSSTKASVGAWHTVVVHLVVNGTASQVETWLDGTQIGSLSKVDAYGTTGIGTLEVGDTATGHTFDVAYDDAAVDLNRGTERTPPSAPAGLAATSRSGSEVDLAWQAAADNVGVAGYTILRNGARIATVGAATLAFADTTVASRTTYTYALQAFDGAGNVSPATPGATVTTPALFADGFESGDLSLWTSDSGLVAQQQLVYAGAWAARATATGSTGASAYLALPRAQPELYGRVRFQLVSHGANPVSLLRLRTSTGAAIGTVSISSTGRLVWRDDVTALATTSSTVVTPGVWHELEAHVLTGSAPLSEVWLDGVKVDVLTRSDSLGSTPVGRVELGDPSTGRTYDVAFDDVSVDPAFLGETSPPTAPTNLTATAASGTEIDLAWTAATDNVGVDHYTVWRDGAAVATLPGTTTSFADSGLAPFSTYTYTVTATDADGNVSPASAAAAATTLDTVPPTAPAGLAATLVSPGEADLTWSASTDNVGVAGYRIFRDGTQIGAVDAATLHYADLTVVSATAYAYTVRAADGAGNLSDPSATATVSTPDATAPTAPTGLTATAVAPTRVDLAWTAATDDVGVTGYTVSRDGVQIASIGAVTSYSDTGALPATAQTYIVRALDAAGNSSPASASVASTTPGTVLLSDGFESAALTGWSNTWMVAQQQEVYGGSWAARATSTGASIFANHPFASASELYVRERVKIVSQGANNVSLLKLRTGTASIGGVFVDSSGRLDFRNDAGAVTTTSTTGVGSGWHVVVVHAVINGASSLAEVWLDGVKVDTLTRADSLGTTAASRIEIGDRTGSRTFDVAVDDVVVSTP